MSLMDQLTHVLASQLGDQAARKTGLDASTASKLAPMAMAVLMRGLQKNAADPAGAEQLSRALDKHDGDLLNRVDRIGADDVMRDGEKILSHILGGKKGQTEKALADAAGVDQGQIGSLLAMAAPMVLASLGRAKRERGLDPAELAGLVTEEGVRAEKNSPNELGGLMKFLDSDGDGDVTEELMGIGAKMLGGLFGGRR